MRLCPLIQLLLALRHPPTAPVPRWCLRHLTDCPACRATHQQELQLHQMLPAPPAQHHPRTPPFLAARILHRLGGEFGRPTGPRGFSRRRLAPGGLAVAAAVALGLGVWLRSPTLSPPATPALPAIPPPLAVPTWLPDAGSLLAFSQRLDAPLAREWELLRADAQTAANTLADAFLPHGRLDF